MAQTDRQTLWVISEPYYPEETSTGYYLTHIAEGLAGDFEVNVICGQPNYSRRGTRAPKYEEHNGVKIFRAFGTTLDKNIIPFRLVNMAMLGLGVFFNAFRRFRSGDRVLVVTNPPSMPFVIAVAALFRGVSYTLLIHDSYPELLTAVGKTRPGSFFVRAASFFNRWLYKYAAKIIVVGRDMAETTRQKVDGLDIPVITIPNWAELEAVSPSLRKENPLLKELGIEEKLVFLYAGNMGHPNDMESIVECAKRLRDDPVFHFVFLGSGAKRKWLEREVEQNELSNITLLDPRPRSEQQLFLNACDVAIVSLVTGMKGVSVPSRTYNAMAAGKPILALAESGSEIDLVVKENNIGWTVSPQKPDELYVCLRDILASQSDLSEMGKRSRLAALREYSAETALKKYKTAMK